MEIGPQEPTPPPALFFPQGPLPEGAGLTNPPSPGNHLHTFLDLHDLAWIKLHLQAPIGLVLVQPAVGREGVPLALAGHANLDTAQEPA